MEWAPYAGKWDFEPELARYRGNDRGAPAGIALSPQQLRSGKLRATVRLAPAPDDLPQARLLFGHDPDSRRYFTAGIGGYNALWVFDQFVPDAGLTPLGTDGSHRDLRFDQAYELTLSLAGDRGSLLVNDVPLLAVTVPRGASEGGVGLFAWAREQVEFTAFSVSRDRPRAFVAMEFGEPFDSLYEQVISPVACQVGFAPRRGDEVYGPGVVIEDIERDIIESAVVIAEVSPLNANVFYEVGYAHAYAKPLILLKQRPPPQDDQRLPFDLMARRHILYDDTKDGRELLATALAESLGGLA